MGGNKEEAIKSLLGGKKQQQTAPADTTSGAAPTQPAPEKKPETAEDKAKKKLNKLLGL